MRNLPLLFILITNLSCVSQKIIVCNKCNVEILIKTQNETNNKNVSEVFCSFESECSKNIEYSQFANELFFFILFNNPEMFIKELSKVEDSKAKLIVKEIQSPINDSFQLDALNEQLNNLKFKNKMEVTKQMIIESIKIAISKYDK